MTLPFIPDLKTAAVVAVVVGVAAFTGGYKVADWRLTARANAETIDRLTAAEQALDDALAERDRLSKQLSTANDQHSAELRKAQNETTSLRDRLRAGAIGLRVAATCPDPKPRPDAQAPSGTGVDTGTGAELDETARRAYFALRDGIDRASAQLAACQDELRLRAK